MGKILTAPPLVKQSDTWHCWAAATESWVKRIYHLDVPQSRLIHYFRGAGHLASNGGLRHKGVGALVKLFGMGCRPPTVPGGTLPLSELLPEANLSGYLKLGPVILMHTLYGNTASPISHTVVVYGVEGNTIFYMDPTKSEYQYRSLADLNRNTLLGNSGIMLYPQYPPWLVKTLLGSTP